MNERSRAPWRADLSVYFAPIRHQSPACARHVERLIAEIEPAAILIEAPADFERFIPVLADPATRPPVAIVAFPAPVVYFPFCAHSPELVALRAGCERGAAVRFIDLATPLRATYEAGSDDADRRGGSRAALTGEHAFDTSDYVRALCERLGCRDGNEVWDHLFESRVDGGDWRAFFIATATYCALVRATDRPGSRERRINAAREAAMLAALDDARATTSGPIVVITGGYHTAPLLDALERPPRAVPLARRREKQAGHTPPASDAYLIRYGFEQLDTLRGYAAGLPLPGFYDRLWRAVRSGAAGPALWRDLAADILVSFAAQFRAERPDLALSLPAVSTALANAVALAQLRGRPGPGRDELLDACRSAFVKGEHPAEPDPVLSAFTRFLGGGAIGELPPSAATLPLVDDVRRAARRLRLRLDDGTPRRRELDIHRERGDRDVSRFLHATALIGCGFADRTAGPDFATGMGVDLLFEHWTYAWSPLVETRLIDVGIAADTLEAACAVELERQIAALEESGRGRTAPAFVPLLIGALSAGLTPHSAGLAARIERALAEDADFASVVAALVGLDRLARARGALGIADPAPLEGLAGSALSRALFLLPEIANVRDADANEAFAALASLRAIVTGADDAELSARFGETIAAMLARDLEPPIEGAVSAVAFGSGAIDADRIIGRMRGTIGGAYVRPADRVGFLRGLIAISRELLWSLPDLIDALDDIIAGIDEDDFIALLPHLRLAFTALDPRETDRLAAIVGAKYGPPATAATLAADVERNRELARVLEGGLIADGLGAWLAPRSAG